MPVTGEGRKGILVIGEAPGEEEDKENEQFVGKGGQLLRKSLKRYGVDLDKDCFKYNALICRTRHDAPPTSDQVGYCAPNVLSTIEELKPSTIIVLGFAALRSVVDQAWGGDVGDSLARWVGWQIPTQKFNAWLCPAYHPDLILKGKEDDQYNLWWQRHIEAACKLEGRPWNAIPNYKAQITPVYDDKRAAKLIRQIIELGGLTAFDYECNRLKPEGPDAKVVSASICWRGKRTIAYPWYGEAIAATEEYLRSPVPKIASNMKFEQRWSMALFNTPGRRWVWDTMIAAHVHDNREAITSIKFQQFVWLGSPSYDDHIQKFLKTRGDVQVNKILTEIDLKHLLIYNGLDSLLEYLVAIKQADMLGIELPTE